MARITPSEALQRASSASQQGMRLVAFKTSKKAVITEYVRDVDENVYLFRKGDNGLVLPAYDDVEPILGEAEKADFTDMPPHVEWWLRGYAADIAWQESRPMLIEDVQEDAEVDKPTASEPRKTIPYMVKTKWGQGSPYNNHLDFGDGKCLVGCPAVMIGQIMHYWGTKGYRRGCTATTDYQWKGERYKVKALPPITMFDYANLTTSKPKTKEQIEAVASMLEHIGKAIKSNYDIDATWAQTDVYPPMMISRLRLGKTIRELQAVKVGEAAFDEAIYKELLAGRPVGICGSNDSRAGSHAFICDGYNAATNKYHLNFGWDGGYDGYYAMTAINLTKDYNYNARKKAWIGLQPEYKLGDANRDGEVNITDAMVTINHGLKGTYDEAADVNSDGKVTVADSTPIINHILGKESL